MSLLTYEETRPWAKSIKEKVIKREMPPWFEKGEMHRFTGDMRLTQDEIDTIVSWVDGNAPKGNPKDMPNIPTFNDGWKLGEPDMIIELDTVSIGEGSNDTLFNVPVPFELDGDRYVTAVEILPEPSQIVHHVILFASDDREGRRAGILNWMQGWAPGINALPFPEGSGRLLKKDAVLSANLHLTPRGEGGDSIIKFGFHLADKGEDLVESFNHWTINNMFKIPANDPNHFVKAAWTAPYDVTVFGLAPHMHYRGKDMKFTAVYPDGKKELLLDSIWSNEWQLFYNPVVPFQFPKGTKIEVTGHFDNSKENELNPNPNEEVKWGLSVKEEMFIGYIDYMPQQKSEKDSD